MKNFKVLISILSIVIFTTFNIHAQKTNDKSGKSFFLLENNTAKFSIKFPANYKLSESSTENNLKTELYRAIKGKEVYMLKYEEHKNPAISSYNENYMEASLESFITGIGASLIKKEEIKQNKNKGTEAFLSLDGKNLNVFFRVFIINKVQFQLVVITKESKKTDEIKSFFNSFICKEK